MAFSQLIQTVFDDQFSKLKIRINNTVSYPTCEYLVQGTVKNKGKLCGKEAQHQIDGKYYCGVYKEDGKTATKHLRTILREKYPNKRGEKIAHPIPMDNRELIEEVCSQRYFIKQLPDNGPFVYKSPTNLHDPIIVFNPNTGKAIGIYDTELKMTKPLTSQAIRLCRSRYFPYDHPDLLHPKKNVEDMEEDDDINIENNESEVESDIESEPDFDDDDFDAEEGGGDDGDDE